MKRTSFQRLVMYIAILTTVLTGCGRTTVGKFGQTGAGPSPTPSRPPITLPTSTPRPSGTPIAQTPAPTAQPTVVPVQQLIPIYRRFCYGNRWYLSTEGGVSAECSIISEMGKIYSSPVANTVALYSCVAEDGDRYTTTDADCENFPNRQKFLLGYIFTSAGANLFPLYRCLSPFLGSHLDSQRSTCQEIPHTPNNGFHPEFRIGFTYGQDPGPEPIPTVAPAPTAAPTVAPTPFYATHALVRRYCTGLRYSPLWITTTQGNTWSQCPVVTPLINIYNEATVPGAIELFRCTLANGDYFDSLSPTCEGQVTIRASLGFVRSAAGAGLVAIHRCYNSALGKHLTSVAANCEQPAGGDNGFHYEQTLGYGIPVGTIPIVSGESSLEAPIYRKFCAASATWATTYTASAADCEVISPLGKTYQLPKQDTACLFRCAANAGGDVYDTTASDCENNGSLAQTLGYTGIVATRPEDDLLFRCYNRRLGRHLATRSASCENSNGQNNGFELEMILGYVGLPVDLTVVTPTPGPTAPPAPTPAPTAAPVPPPTPSTYATMDLYRRYCVFGGVPEWADVNDSDRGACLLTSFIGKLFRNQEQYTIPLYQCYNFTSGEHYTTTSASCDGGSTSMQVRLGFISNARFAANAVPLYSCYNSPLRRHLTTTSSGCEQAAGFYQQKFLGYSVP